MSTGATDMTFLRAKGMRCYGVGPAVDQEDGPLGFGAHSDQERIREEELYRFQSLLYDAVVRLAGAAPSRRTTPARRDHREHRGARSRFVQEDSSMTRKGEHTPGTAPFAAHPRCTRQPAPRARACCSRRRSRNSSPSGCRCVSGGVRAARRSHRRGADPAGRAGGESYILVSRTPQPLQPRYAARGAAVRYGDYHTSPSRCPPPTRAARERLLVSIGRTRLPRPEAQGNAIRRGRRIGVATSSPTRRRSGSASPGGEPAGSRRTTRRPRRSCAGAAPPWDDVAELHRYERRGERRGRDARGRPRDGARERGPDHVRHARRIAPQLRRQCSRRRTTKTGRATSPAPRPWARARLRRRRAP